MSRKAKIKSPPTPAQVIARRRAQISTNRGYASLLRRIVFIAVICWLMLTQVFMLTQAQGNEMFPAVTDGDLIVAFRLQKEYAKDDVAVYTVNGKHRIGRVVARGTDNVTIDENGVLLVNGTVQSGKILYPSFPREGGITYPYTVPDGHLFVMGDYRTQSEDSRDYGPIPMENVEAKVIAVLRRRGI